jgi:hypothetical protein
MSNDVKFIDGLMFRPPVKKDGSPLPHFIKAKGSIKRAELINALQGMEGEWVNFDVKESKGGKWYASVDEWTPTKDQEYSKGVAEAKAAMAPADDFEDDIPF